MRDAAVGKVLRAQAQVIALLLPEQHAGGQVVAVLEMGGEIGVGVDAQIRQQVEADRGLEVGHQRRARGALEPEHRGDADVPHLLVRLAGLERPAPAPDLQVPVGAERPCALGEPALLPPPLQAEAPQVGIFLAFANLERHPVEGVRA